MNPEQGSLPSVKRDTLDTKAKMSAEPFTASTAPDTAVTSSPPPAASSLINPVPLSIPALLVNPKARNPSAARPSSSGPRRNQPLLPNGKIDRTGRRKILRRENSRLSGNPHVVRPRATDYAPAHSGSDSYKTTFPTPVPSYLASLNVDDAPRDERVARDWRREWEDQMQSQRRDADDAQQGARIGDRLLQPGARGMEAANLATSSAPPQSGLFTMSLPEARFFLKRRAGVRCRIDGVEAEPVPPMTAITPMQDLVNRVEEEFAAWIDQVVYLSTEGSRHGTDTTKLNAQPKVIVPDLSLATASSSSTAPSARVEEHHHLPHSLSYLIRDPFDRLAVHCLARVWGLRSLSKPVASNGPGSQKDSKLTWIFKPASKGRAVRRPDGPTASAAGGIGPIDVTNRQAGSAPTQNGYINPLIRHLANVGISNNATQGSSANAGTTRQGPLRSARIHVPETPPTTDIGSELDSGSEVGFGLESSSELDGEGDSASESGRPGRRGGLDTLSDVAESDSESESGAAGRGLPGHGEEGGAEADETLRAPPRAQISIHRRVATKSGAESEGYSDYEGEYEYDEDELDADAAVDSADEEGEDRSGIEST